MIQLTASAGPRIVQVPHVLLGAEVLCSSGRAIRDRSTRPQVLQCAP